MLIIEVKNSLNRVQCLKQFFCIILYFYIFKKNTIISLIWILLKWYLPEIILHNVLLDTLCDYLIRFETVEHTYVCS